MRAKRSQTRRIPKTHAGHVPEKVAGHRARPPVSSEPAGQTVISPADQRRLGDVAQRYAACVGGAGISAALELLEKATRAETWFREQVKTNPLRIPAVASSREASEHWMRKDRHARISGADAPADVNPVLCRYVWMTIERARQGSYFAPGGSYLELRVAVADLIPQPGRGKRFMSPLWSERGAVATYHQSRQGSSDEYLVKVQEIERGERDGATGWNDPVKPEALARIRTLKSRGRRILYNLYGRDEDKPVRNRKP